MVKPSSRLLQAGQHVPAPVVDDSAVLRHLAVRSLERDPSIEVVAPAPNGSVALKEPKILVAAGDSHMRLATPVSGRFPEVVLDQGPPENSCRPAVDALFFSASQTFGGATPTIFLTGMAQDGLPGAGAVKSRGGFVVAQHETTSAVWGLPGAASKAGLADLALPLSHIVPEMLARFTAVKP
jgi:two-component system chemotaxis response regulator CheB